MKYVQKCIDSFQNSIMYRFGLSGLANLLSFLGVWVFFSVSLSLKSVW